MTTSTPTHPLLAAPRPAPAGVPDALAAELGALAAAHDDLAVRSRVLFEQLRKMLGQDRLAHCLLGVQALAARGEPAGARLLAAFLDANTPGSQLIPHLREFASTARYRRLAAPANIVADARAAIWLRQLDAVVAQCERSDPGGGEGGRRPSHPREAPPLPLLRRTLVALVPGPGDAALLTPARRRLLADLARLETDAHQERVSRLAGIIDPFRVSAVMRALPLLSRADAEIRDLNRFVTWLDEGDDEAAFRRRLPRYHEVLEEHERPRLVAAIEQDTRLAPLARLHAAQARAPRSVRQLAGAMAGLLALGRQLVLAGVREQDLDLLAAADLVLSSPDGAPLRLTLPPALREAVVAVLIAPSREDGWSAASLGGFLVDRDDLVLRDGRQGLGDRIWRHDLPTIAEMAGAAPAAAEPDARRRDPAREGSDAVRQLVMANLGCVSILLGFLRNPKVVAIPGLVAEVARRSRSLRVLETIANDRALHAGFANKDVPRALLESPVNVPIKTLRKFIHVKYVSRVDLRRLAMDKTRLRKEVVAEIQDYLDSLC